MYLVETKRERESSSTDTIQLHRQHNNTTRTMAHNQVNEIDELLKDLKKTPGFKAYLILNSDGIVIRWDQADNVAEGSSQVMTYQSAVQHAHHITELYNKSTAHIKELFEPEDGPVENVRLRTEEYEMIISSIGNYTLAVFQDDGSNE